MLKSKYYYAELEEARLYRVETVRKHFMAVGTYVMDFILFHSLIYF